MARRSGISCLHRANRPTENIALTPRKKGEREKGGGRERSAWRIGKRGLNAALPGSPPSTPHRLINHLLPAIPPRPPTPAIGQHHLDLLLPLLRESLQVQVRAFSRIEGETHACVGTRAKFRERNREEVGSFRGRRGGQEILKFRRPLKSSF